MNQKTEGLLEKRVQEKNRHVVLTRLAGLTTMSLKQLQKEWELYNNGEPAPNYKKQFLLKKLAWRIQEAYYGGLSTEATAQIKAKASVDPKSKIERIDGETHKPNKGILPGTRFVRIWNGNRYEVVALESGFEFQNQVYRSLTAIAKEITGVHWNGRVFFGVRNKK